MAKNTDPVILELAPLPREQIGPFLLLGLDKDAGAEEIEAQWAERIKTARKRQIAVDLGDINWAREVLSDPERRIQADVTSLNPDTAAGFLGQLAREFGAATGGKLPWQPIELEPGAGEPEPPAPLPSASDLLAQLRAPAIPEDIPAVAPLLREFVEQPLDPWKLDLGESNQP